MTTKYAPVRIVNPYIQLALSAATPTYVDVSGEVTAVQLHATVDTIDVPRTAAFPPGVLAGDPHNTIEIGYLATPGTPGAFFPLLESAIAASDGSLLFQFRFTTSAVSVTNPQYTGIFVVTAADVGGTMGTLSVGSSTFPLNGTWTKATS